MALRSLLLSVRYGGGGEDSSYPRGQVTESRGRCFQVSSGIHAHPGSDGPLLLCVLPTPPPPHYNDLKVSGKYGFVDPYLYVSHENLGMGEE